MIIERLITWMEEAPTEARARATDALVRAWHHADMSDDQRDAAEAAMTCILDDPDSEVRIALAEALCDLPDAPRHLVLSLAGDETRVSLPILANCSALLDVELIHHVRIGDDEQQMAIAGRPHVSAPLCSVMAREAGVAACLALVTNPDARLVADDFHAMAERFGDQPDLRSCLLVRHDIGMRARVLLIEHYAKSLVETEDEGLGTKCDDKALARRERELQDVCEKATITFAAQITDQEIHDLVCALIEREKLTTVFLLRAICMGNLSLFAHALAVLSDQPLGRVERILKDRRSNAMHALCAAAGLPMSALPVFSAAIHSWRKYLEADTDYLPEQLPYLVTREILAGYEGSRDSVVDELLMLLRRICTEAARDSARSKIEQITLEQEQTIALPAPEPDPVPEADAMSDEETIAFMMQFAEELADMALQDERDLNNAAEVLVAANAGEDTTDDEAFARSLELPPVMPETRFDTSQAA